VNEAFLSITEYKKFEIIGQPFEMLLKNEHEIMEMMNCKERNGKIDKYETIIRTKTNNDLPISLSCAMRKDSTGEILGCFVTFQDISERKQMDKLLSDKIEKLEQNKLAMLNMMEDFHEMILSLEQAKLQIKEKNKKLVKNARHLREINTKLNKAQKELSALNQDLELKVEERTEKIQNLLHQKEEFISQLSHDLKTPLTPLYTLLPIVRKKVDDSKLHELLDISIRNVNYMKNLVTKTLDLARLNSPSMELDIEQINLLDIFHQVLESKEVDLQKNQITVKNQLQNDIVIEGDYLRLREVFDNLISNAIKYSRESDGIITLNAQVDSAKITIAVQDNGQGIPKNKIQYIFDEFYKADESRHDFESIGLGLSICQRIVNYHGGRIWVESKGVGHGCTFFVLLKKTVNNDKININKIS